MRNRSEFVDLRVATMNIWRRHGAWEDRRGALRQGFAELRPDVVGLTESDFTDGYCEAADILGDGYHVVHQELALLGDGNSVAIASRWPIGETRELDQLVTPRSHDYPVTSLLAEILAPEPLGPFWFVNHIPSYRLNMELERELQAVNAARAVEALVERGARHVILAGDLDADPSAASIRFFTGRQSLAGMSVCYRDAWESVHPGEAGETLTPQNPLFRKQAPDWPFRRVDYILVRCDGRGPSLRIDRCERIFDAPIDGVWASDHYGVMADLSAIG